MLYSTSYASPLGAMTLASDGKNIVGLWIVGQKYFAEKAQAGFVEKPDLPVFGLAEAGDPAGG